MTLEELQAAYPHGSRWQAAPHVRVVVGWQPADEPTEGKVLFTTEGYGSDSITVERTYFVRRDYKRIPEPVPCPITEPVEIREHIDFYDGSRWYATGPTGDQWRDQWGDQWGDQPAITLHPPRDGEGFMRATWEGGPE